MNMFGLIEAESKVHTMHGTSGRDGLDPTQKDQATRRIQVTLVSVKELMCAEVLTHQKLRRCVALCEQFGVIEIYVLNC